MRAAASTAPARAGSTGIAGDGADLGRLLTSAHDAIRSIDGLHPDEALDELCKVILATASRLSPSAKSKVAALLARCPRSGDQLDLHGHAFQQVIEPAARAGMGQYFTPAGVVDFMVRAVAPRAARSILDPFCGSAQFLVAARASARKGTGPRCTGIDKSDRMVRIARARLLLQGTRDVEIRSGDALAPFSRLDGLEPGHFELVLTNPPFGALLGREALAGLDRFELAPGRGSVPLELLGLERSLQFLAPGGLLAIVLPEGILTNARTAPARAWIGARTKLLALASLPLATFTPFGANVKTSILFARKLRPGEQNGDHDVLLLRLDDIGHDASGRRTSDRDLDAGAAAVARVVARER